MLSFCNLNLLQSPGVKPLLLALVSVVWRALVLLPRRKEMPLAGALRVENELVLKVS